MSNNPFRIQDDDHPEQAQTSEALELPEESEVAQDYFSRPTLTSQDSADDTPRPKQWHIPDYGEQRQLSEIPEEVEPHSLPQDFLPGQTPNEDRRESDASDATLQNAEETVSGPLPAEYDDPYYPYGEIARPEIAYHGSGRPDGTGQRVWFADDPQIARGKAESGEYEPSSTSLRRRSIPANLADLQAIDAEEARHGLGGRLMGRRPSYSRADSSYMSDVSEFDPDDPRMTGIQGDLERNNLKNMSYRARRKHLMRSRIEFNVSSMVHRQRFIRKLARALIIFGAPSHRIESQLVAAARILEVEAEFIHLPGVVICSFGDQELGRSQTHFVRCSGRLSLGALHKVHVIYRAVVHDEISAKQATEDLEAVMNSPPPYSILVRCVLSFLVSASICPLAFGGSFLDLWIAGASGLLLAALQLSVAAKSALYANVFEISVSILISFVARGLSSIPSRIFCYTAISSAGIVGILPGYLILSSSLELASRNIVCGSVKMVYALIYTLFLGFGLQIGSDIYLLFDSRSRKELHHLALNMTTTAIFSGTWNPDNSTDPATTGFGTWSFSRAPPLGENSIVNGCFRPANFPWYLQAFPLWTVVITVPLFSITLSLTNLQPFKSKQLPVMVIISCCSYASNRVANHYIFNRSDVVSAIGAFTVGLLGNIYSRKMGGTAFTSMVTGVLFLVPSGLSQAGGITANGNGIDIGGAMIAVTIGITVGLFMSQALVYTFGTRKNAAIFSF